MTLIDAPIMQSRREAARALRAEGLTYKQIADRLGISVSYANQLVLDPDGTKALARKKKGRCVDCGTATYSDGPSSSPQQRCGPCQRRQVTASARWTADTIIAAVRRWVEMYGEVPASTAWNTGLARPFELERYRAGDWPAYFQVCRTFGNWTAGIRAAGFEPRSPLAGRLRNKVSEDEYRAMERMKAAGHTYAEIGEAYGIKGSAVAERIKRRRRKGADGMAASLKAETVLEREIKRFEDRRDRAQEEARDAAEQVERLRLALDALSNGKPAT